MSGGVEFVNLVGRDDMIVRVRAGRLERAARQSLSHTRLPEKVARSPTGTYEVHSVTDGVDRVLSYHALPDYPLVLVVGLARDEILADYQGRQRWLSFVGVLISIIFVGAALLLIRQIDRQARTEQELRQHSMELGRQAIKLNESREEADLANRAKSQFLAI